MWCGRGGGGRVSDPHIPYRYIAYWSAPCLVTLQSVFFALFIEILRICVLDPWHIGTDPGPAIFVIHHFSKVKIHKEVTTVISRNEGFSDFFLHDDRRIRIRIRTRTTYGSGFGRLKNIRIRIPNTASYACCRYSTFIHRSGFKNKVDAHPFLRFRTRLVQILVYPIQGLQAIFWSRISIQTMLSPLQYWFQRQCWLKLSPKYDISVLQCCHSGLLTYISAEHVIMFIKSASLSTRTPDSSILCECKVFKFVLLHLQADLR